MSRLCITADDYGMHPCVNAGIENLASQRCISAVAVMVHPKAVLDSLERLHETTISTGLHLVFTQEEPLSRELKGSPLAPNGKLPSSPYALIAALMRRPHLRRLLIVEAMAQLDRYESLGLEVDFINSHEHIHEVPVLWNVVAQVAEKAKVGALRSSHLQPISATKQGALAMISRISRYARSIDPSFKILSPLGAGHAGAMTLPLVENFLRQGLAWHAKGCTLPELVVHPAISNEELLELYGPAVGNRSAEYKLLASPEIKNLWRQYGVELVGP